jgi:hypothetical protein
VPPFQNVLLKNIIFQSNQTHTWSKQHEKEQTFEIVKKTFSQFFHSENTCCSHFKINAFLKRVCFLMFSHFEFKLLQPLCSSVGRHKSTWVISVDLIAKAVPRNDKSLSSTTPFEIVDSASCGGLLHGCETIRAISRNDSLQDKTSVVLGGLRTPNWRRHDP